DRRSFAPWSAGGFLVRAAWCEGGHAQVDDLDLKGVEHTSVELLVDAIESIATALLCIGGIDAALDRHGNFITLADVAHIRGSLEPHGILCGGSRQVSPSLLFERVERALDHLEISTGERGPMRLHLVAG